MAAAAEAGEYAVLSSGFRLYAERHEIHGQTVLLYSRDGGVTEMDAGLISEFEQELAAPQPQAGPQPAKPPATVRDLVDQAAARQGLPPQFVHSVVAAESAYRADAVSPKGAIGLMQLLPATARTFDVNPFDPAQNVEAGAKYLRELLVKYDGDPVKALAAYNAGPGAVAKYQGLPPYAETRTYVQRVLRNYQKSGSAPVRQPD
jgi:soluble lytic murein transglycosylase-like protein